MLTFEEKSVPGVDSIVEAWVTEDVLLSAVDGNIESRSAVVMTVGALEAVENKEEGGTDDKSKFARNLSCV